MRNRSGRKIDKDYVELICFIGEFIPLDIPDLADIVQRALKGCRDYEALLIMLQLIGQTIYQETEYG